MIDWLIYPTELGEEPKTIDLVGTYEENEEIFYVYKFTSDNTKCYIGGLVGASYGDTYLNNCYNEGNITGGGYEIGGLIGYISPTYSSEEHYIIINNCHNSGNLIGNGSNVEYYGGCVGWITASGDIYLYNS